jgi:hypothetical protein
VLVVSAWSPWLLAASPPRAPRPTSVSCLWSASFRPHYRGMDSAGSRSTARLMPGRMLVGRIACSCGQTHHLAMRLRRRQPTGHRWSTMQLARRASARPAS